MSSKAQLSRNCSLDPEQQSRISRKHTHAPASNVRA